LSINEALLERFPGLPGLEGDGSGANIHVHDNLFARSGLCASWPVAACACGMRGRVWRTSWTTSAPLACGPQSYAASTSTAFPRMGGRVGDRW